MVIRPGYRTFGINIQYASILKGQPRSTWIFHHLETNEKRDSFNAVVATIHIITHEQEVCVGRLS